MTRTILILALVPFLAGCDLMRILEGKPSDAQIEYERREQAGEPQIENPWIEPVKLVADVPAQAPEPEPCREIFRQTVCRDGVEYPFEW